MSVTARRLKRSIENSNVADRAKGQARAVGGVFLGREIRDLRKAKGLTLAALSQACGYSISFLSQLERSISRPSIKCLHDISSALGVGISWFFGDTAPAFAEERDHVVRASRRRRLEFESGITDELLSPNLSGQVELLLCRLAPGASSGEESYEHQGEEAGLILTGTLELWVGDKHFVLKAGDSFSFPSTERHRYRNPSDEETQVVWAVAPPTY
jgi:transcriptional regulator with XRE-family HTH domain